MIFEKEKRFMFEKWITAFFFFFNSSNLTHHIIFVGSKYYAASLKIEKECKRALFPQDCPLRSQNQRPSEAPHTLMNHLLPTSSHQLTFVSHILLMVNSCLSSFRGISCLTLLSVFSNRPSSRHHQVLFGVLPPVSLITTYHHLCPKVHPPELDMQDLP